MLGRIATCPLPPVGPDWSALLPGIALWALALYLPLSLPLARLEQALAEGSLDPGLQQLLLVLASLALALAIGTLTELGLGWALGPSWASSLGLMAAGWGLFTALASRARDSGE
jgi:protein-S-isoprenylcysteine O-methyltransferase Ste14